VKNDYALREPRSAARSNRKKGDLYHAMENCPSTEERDCYETNKDPDEERESEQGVIKGEDEGDNIFQPAIEYCMTGSYPPGLTKDKKRAVRKRAKAVTVENGEVYLQRRKNKVCMLLLQALFLVCGSVRHT